MEVSKTKCICTATTRRIGTAVADGMKVYGIKYCEEVKSLGVGMAAGKKRPDKTQRARLKGFKARLGRFRLLARAGKSATRVLRTGGASGRQGLAGQSARNGLKPGPAPEGPQSLAQARLCQDDPRTSQVPIACRQAPPQEGGAGVLADHL